MANANALAIFLFSNCIKIISLEKPTSLVLFRFFRTIRLRLLGENKISKYLLYALGEIILVVIGILIALRINNWNENRKLYQEEKATIASLKLVFKKTSVPSTAILPPFKELLIRATPYWSTQALITYMAPYPPWTVW